MQDVNIKLDLTEVVAIQDAKLKGICVALILLILDLCKTETVDREKLYKRISLAISRSDKQEHGEQTRNYLEHIRDFISPEQKASEGDVINFPEAAPESQ
ncbi:hypothetical protein [uncultured Microbulbifer sp.]|uniref:hypothetical protein n=1 Tax=uncultured Microbulbifer sp. TaxID=348147 RepID=UPI00260F026C|nr:hypothetical protein [uncultured Microbulbifer sp.]